MHRPNSEEQRTPNRSNAEAGQDDELFSRESAAQFNAIMDEAAQYPTDPNANEDFEFPEDHLNSLKNCDKHELPEDTLPEMDLILANETIL